MYTYAVKPCAHANARKALLAEKKKTPAQSRRRSITGMQILPVNDISSCSSSSCAPPQAGRKKKTNCVGRRCSRWCSRWCSRRLTFNLLVHYDVLPFSVTSSLPPQSTKTEPSGGKPCPATPSPAAPWTSARGAPFPATTAWSRCPSTGRWPTPRPAWSTS